MLLWTNTPTVASSCAPPWPTSVAEMARYGVCCLAVLFFLGQLARPDSRVARVEAAIVASLCASPMGAITPVALAALRTCRLQLLVRTVADSYRAGSLRLALRSSELDTIRGLLDHAASGDDTLLVPAPRRGSIVAPSLSCARSAGRQRSRLLRLSRMLGPRR